MVSITDIGSLPGETAGFDVPKLTRSTLNEEVYERLKEALMMGKIAPGSTMTIRSLAQSFGISMMPVREALRRLVAEHVLIMLPNRSVALPVFTAERFREITRIRVELEGLAAEEGARHLQPAEIDRLAYLTDLMEQSRAEEPGAGLDWNREFHFILYTASRMPTLVAMIEGLWLQIGPLLNLPMALMKQARPGIYEHHHRAIAGLRAGNAREVRAAIADDIQAAAVTIARRLVAETRASGEFPPP